MINQPTRQATMLSLSLSLWFIVTILTVTGVIHPIPFYAELALDIGLLLTCAYFVGSIIIEVWMASETISLQVGLPIDGPVTAAIMGYVYLLKTSEGYYKIGRTRDPQKRRETFNVKLPFRVEYEHLIPCNNRFVAERTLHVLFRHVRMDGEWFKLSVSDVEFIKSIKRL